jgi:hypothetical protein
MCSLIGLSYSGVRFPLYLQRVRMDVVTLVCVAHTLSWNCLILWHPEARVRFPALPEKSSNGSGTGSAQPREYN